MSSTDRLGNRSSGLGTAGAQISTETVQLFRRYTGRGPSKAHTWIKDDTVFIFLRETLTTGERTLVAEGHEQEVLDARRLHQRAMRRELTELVERNLGRKVTALVSLDSVDPDLACELFVLDGSKLLD
jgi:uncharacterized protein YbcI